ncbi:uncharacterized protein LOC110697008 isoform X3 [Chenopodium quinoa]|uniref:uncharacterized protein LOC110697008 isoform X3 n=1 Tax=Chenopodium quinoa TaxID=63459 RepID=UPI000B797AE5|nr:uncharacterized protein LOC110697008 isoform X3 [Chenopodium quinoa]
MSSPENHLSFSLLLIFSLLTLTFSQSLSSENHLLLPSNRKFGQDDQLFCESWRFSVETNDAGIWYTIPTRCFDFVKNYVTSDRCRTPKLSPEMSWHSRSLLMFPAMGRMLGFSMLMKLFSSICLIMRIMDMDKRPESHPTVLNSIRDLATSCQLQYLHFGGHLCEHLAAGGVTKSLPLSFNYLSKLCLTTIKINRVNVYHFAIGMVKSCPRIKDLEILIRNEGKAVIQHEIDFDYRIDSYKLGHLTKVEFTGITGTIAELKFIEYLLAVSEVLELFLFKCNNLDATSELKLSRDLLRLRRASTKAQLICMEQHRI